MTVTRPTITDDLEHRLDKARDHLRHVAAYVAGPGATDDLVAGAYDSVASLAAATATQLRGEQPLR